MALVPKSGTPSLSTLLLQSSNKITGLFVGANVNAGDACYINAADGKIYPSNGVAAAPAAEVDGWALTNGLVAQNDAVTLVFDCTLNYGSGLTPGQKLYVSAATPGALDSAATTGGVKEVARAIDTTRIYVQRSRY